MDFPTIKITIIPFQFPFTGTPYMWFGNKVIPLDGRNRKWKKLLVWRKAKKTLRNVHSADRIDGILCCWLGECSLIGMKFAGKNGIPLLLWSIGQDAKPGNRYLNYLRASEKNIAVIGEHQRGLLRASRINCDKLIPNGILPEAFPVPEKNFSIHVFGAGSLTELKNYSEFIESISIVSKTLPGVKCEIGGNGPQRGQLEELIKQKKLEKNISLCEALSHEEVIRKMSGSLIFLHPSTYEGNSTAIIEAAYCGNYILCKKNVATFNSKLIKTYSSVNEAAEIITNILQNNSQKAEGELLSSIHDSARKIIDHLKMMES